MVFDKYKKRLKKVREEIKEVNQNIVRLEDKMDNRPKALYDGYKQNTEKLCNVECKLNDLSSRV